MAEPNERAPRGSDWLALALLLGLLFGGAAAGQAVARALAPGSVVAEWIGFFMLPLALALGLQLWLGLWLLLALIGLARRPQRWSSALERSPRARSARGAWVFVPVAVGIGGMAGVLMAVTAAAPAALLVCPLAGLLYGLTTWSLARSGWLRLPKHE
jgi:hypothetical protein